MTGRRNKTRRSTSRKFSRRNRPIRLTRYSRRGGGLASKADYLIAQAEALKNGMHGGGLKSRYNEAIQKLKRYLHALRVKLSRKGFRSKKETEKLVHEHNAIVKYLTKEKITGDFHVSQYGVPTPFGFHHAMTSFDERNDPAKAGKVRKMYSSSGSDAFEGSMGYHYPKSG